MLAKCQAKLALLERPRAKLGDVAAEACEDPGCSAGGCCSFACAGEGSNLGDVSHDFTRDGGCLIWSWSPIL